MEFIILKPLHKVLMIEQIFYPDKATQEISKNF